MKSALLGGLSTFSFVYLLPFEEVSWNRITFCHHALHGIYIWLRSVNNEVYFTRGDSNLSAVSRFHLRDFPEIPYLTLCAHVLNNLSFLWRAVDNERHLTWETIYHLGCFSSSFQGIFLKLNF